MAFDEFGNVVHEEGDTTLLPHGFAGGLYDRDTGLVRFGARDYDPYAGRWTARDRILFRGGDTNLYAYVSNDPVNLLDPTGKYLLPGALLGAGIEIAIQASQHGTDFASYDVSDIAVAAAFGAIGGGIGSGIRSLAAPTAQKYVLSGVVFGQLGILERLTGAGLNSAQVSPTDIAIGASFGAASGMDEVGQFTDSAMGMCRKWWDAEKAKYAGDIADDDFLR